MKNIESLHNYRNN